MSEPLSTRDFQIGVMLVLLCMVCVSILLVCMLMQLNDIRDRLPEPVKEAQP